MLTHTSQFELTYIGWSSAVWVEYITGVQ